MTVSDRIEKQVTLAAPLARVWRAISDAREFGQWFGFELDGPFEEGRTMRGTFHGEFDEAAIMERQRQLGVPPSRLRQLEKNAVFCKIERIEPEHYFSFRWIPYGIDAEVDVEREPMTLVEFRLQSVGSGTQVTVTESGFDQVPAHRRARAFRMNEGGWSAQGENLRKHVESE
jgi:uncharacterized protein YndB with AHSA1/START domain